MPRRACFKIGCYYHLYNRGNNYQDIFFCRDNYLHFLRLLRQHLVEQSVDILAYCLMPNHYHLLIQSQTSDVSSRMRSLSLAYTKAMNRRYGRVGSLFQGRFQSICVESDDYLCQLTQYIHSNPVKAGLVAAPENWEFSSYPDYANLRQGTLPNLSTMQLFLGSETKYQQWLLESSSTLKPHTKVLLLDE